MVNKKKKSEIKTSLNKLSKQDTFSMLLFTLYKLKDDPRYAVLSELCYILDRSNLTRFLSFFGGMTIKIPTMKELRLMLQAMLLYQHVHLENGDLNEGLQTILSSSDNEFKAEEILEVYQKCVEVSEYYDFDRHPGE